MSRPVGILALQGAYQKHVDSLSRLGMTSQLIRKPIELDDCSALILPGGESTTISLLIQEYGFYDAIRSFSADHPVMGVCAGLILMAEKVDDDRVTPLALMPFKATRNVYGRQVHSFSADIKPAFTETGFRAQFIRAPGIENISENIEILATHEDKAVMVASGKHIAMSFHPELSDSTAIHEYWLNR
ncbi:MAG: pyridoxal 5'-phosphate synthase glutaminase subunit PdxT [Proteobacteria bacterium]|nr:pyridoxal 5'-phosphate synthase glutaminase subunit PdxT [Pseudomonadota bacterium]